MTWRGIDVQRVPRGFVWFGLANNDYHLVWQESSFVKLTSQVDRNHGTNDNRQEEYLDRARHNFNKTVQLKQGKQSGRAKAMSLPTSIAMAFTKTRSNGIHR